MSEPIRKSTLVRALLLIGLFLGVAAGAAPCRAQTIDQFAIPTPVTNPFGIAAAGGNLWFTESNATNIGKITTAGAITELPMGTSSLYIAADPGGGSLWFTANGISNITTAGVVTNYPGVSGQGIAFTPDGGLWLNHGDGVARAEKSNPSPATTVVYKVASATTTYGVTRGSDGNIWFIVLDHYNTDPNKTGRIAKIDLGLLNGCTGTPASCITEYPVPGGESAVGTSLALGPGSDGAVWSKGIGKVNRIAPDGTITQYDAPGTGGGNITTGPDGALWYAGTFPGKIGRVTTSGSVTEIPAGADRLSGITAGPDGNIWFCAQSTANFIGRVNLTAAPPPTPTPPAAPLRGNVTPLAVRPPQSIVSPRP